MRTVFNTERILVPPDRHRKHLGDIGSLKDSIRTVGVLHPIVITPAGRLVAGSRRLEACRQLGWEYVPVTIVSELFDARALLFAERDENICRLDMNVLEKVSLGRALEELELPALKQRKIEGQHLGGHARKLGRKLRPSSSRHPRLVEIVGPAVGLSGSTYGRAKAVVIASEDTALPKEVRDAAAMGCRQMAETGKVLAAYDALTRAKKNGARTTDHKHQQNGKSVNARTYKGRSTADGVRAAINTLIGLASGLSSFDVNDVCPTDAESQEWNRELAQVVSSINRIRKQLRSRPA